MKERLHLDAFGANFPRYNKTKTFVSQQDIYREKKGYFQ